MMELKRTKFRAAKPLYIYCTADSTAGATMGMPEWHCGTAKD